MMACREGSGGMARPIPDLGTRWRWVVNITPTAGLPPGKNPGIHWIGSWMCPKNREEEISYLLRGFFYQYSLVFFINTSPYTWSYLTFVQASKSENTMPLPPSAVWGRRGNKTENGVIASQIKEQQCSSLTEEGGSNMMVEKYTQQRAS